MLVVQVHLKQIFVLSRKNLKLVERKDSTERGTRPSAWFTLKKLQ